MTEMAWFKSSIAGLSQPIEHFVKERHQENAEKASPVCTHWLLHIYMVCV